MGRFMLRYKMGRTVDLVQLHMELNYLLEVPELDSVPSSAKV